MSQHGDLSLHTSFLNDNPKKRKLGPTDGRSVGKRCAASSSHQGSRKLDARNIARRESLDQDEGRLVPMKSKSELFGRETSLFGDRPSGSARLATAHLPTARPMTTSNFDRTPTKSSKFDCLLTSFAIDYPPTSSVVDHTPPPL